MGGQGLVEESAIAARVDESRVQLGIVAVTPCLAEQPDHGALGMPVVRLEAGEQLVRDGQPGVQLERAPERFFGAFRAVG